MNNYLKIYLLLLFYSNFIILCLSTNETISIRDFNETLNISLINFNTTISTNFNQNHTTTVEKFTQSISTNSSYSISTSTKDSLTTTSNMSVSIKDLFKANDDIFYQIYLKLLLNVNNRNDLLVSYISTNKTVIFLILKNTIYS
jgi:hypothetical protein